MTEHLLFIIGISFLIVHEMDAIRCREWKIYPGLSFLSDKVGQLVFIYAHIPLLFLVFYQLLHNSNNNQFIRGLDIFMIVHVGLHLIFIRHKKNEFKDFISWTLIIGAGLFGLLDLLI